jgi:hypothetical protein
MMKAVTAFAKLSLHAKLHQQLDSMQTRINEDVARIEAAEIRAYDNDAAYNELEKLKREALSIRFV